MKEALNLIANANSDEKDELYGNCRGDQTGHEINGRPWYDNSWVAVFRHKDLEKAEQVANFMEKCIVNGYIGYSSQRKGDVFERETLFNNMVANGFKPEELSTHCHCDCASLVYTAVYNAYRVAFDRATATDNSEPSNLPLVHDFEEYLNKIGADKFNKFTDTTHLNTDNYLDRGDILISSGHVGVWI